MALTSTVSMSSPRERLNYLRWIAEMIELYLGGKLLDLGAGIGAVTTHYAPGREIVACDRSDDCVAALRHRFQAAPNVTVLQKDLRELSDLGQRFESVVMLNVLEHIEDDVGVLCHYGSSYNQAGGSSSTCRPSICCLAKWTGSSVTTGGTRSGASRRSPASRAASRHLALRKCARDTGLASLPALEHGSDLRPEPVGLGPHRSAVEPSPRATGSSPRGTQPSRRVHQSPLTVTVTVSRVSADPAD